jgi:hypothetical protein
MVDNSPTAYMVDNSPTACMVDSSPTAYMVDNSTEDVDQQSAMVRSNVWTRCHAASEQCGLAACILARMDAPDSTAQRDRAVGHGSESLKHGANGRLHCF